MPFVEPLTIKEAIGKVDKKCYLLPAIQREFVWKTEQIERLFDSLMRDYPISSFLFWEVEKSNIPKYQFYEFIRDYHERDQRHNPKADLYGESGITAILDGQQRLTSLYIGLKGTYTSKLPRKKWDDDAAFPKRKLYLNLLSPSDEEDLEFSFKFLTKDEAEINDKDNFWFPVGKILDLNDPFEVNNFLIQNQISSLEDINKARFANKTLFKLHSIIHMNKSINFFLERGESLDKVLNIFIRVNSGGTQLNYSDLLLSVATAQWKVKDAREEITSLVDEINKFGDGFNINKDFVLKNCLVLGGFRDVAFKVDNFNQDNMIAIENKWNEISKAIKATFVLLHSFGYQRDTLTSNNAVIPISAYLYKIGSPTSFSVSHSYKEDRDKILKFIVSVLLKRTFGGQPDNVLRPIREVIDNSDNGFPLEGIVNKLRGSAKSILFNDDEIDNLFYYQYAQAYTYSSLAFIYPSLDFRNKFHQDHIFPQKLFNRKELARQGIADDEIDFFLKNYNCLANLQLLDGTQNIGKSATEFDCWIKKEYSDEQDRKAYMKRNYIPNVDLSLKNFKEFIEERKKLIFAAFKKDLLV